MKKSAFYLFIILLTIGISSGCSKSDNYSYEHSSLVVKGVTKTNGDTTSTLPTVFTSDEILWFNGTTQEIRFENNISLKSRINDFSSLSFYIDDLYLFSLSIMVSSPQDRVVNAPLLFYNQMENKFFLKDGYPEISSLGLDQERAQKEREEKMQAISTGWTLFIATLKKEHKYRE